MRNEFTSPDDFLEYLKIEFANPITPGGGDSGEFERTTMRQLKEHVPSSEWSEQDVRNYAPVIDFLVNKILLTLPESLRQRVTSSVAIGALHTGEVNAMCVKSPDKKYAILMNYGTMNLLHKYYKLMFGSFDPRAVTYCNRKDATELTTDDLRAYAKELIQSYTAHRVPYGAMIKLDPASPLAVSDAMFLTVSELFIICHELGHFLNGDLDRDENFSLLNRDSWLKRFNDNKKLDVEYKADITGYKLLEQILEKQLGLQDKRFTLLSVMTLFDVLYLISGGKSSSHPNPLNRTLNISEHFYGAQLTEAIKQSYDDPDVLSAVLLENR